MVGFIEALAETALRRLRDKGDPRTYFRSTLFLTLDGASFKNGPLLRIDAYEGLFGSVSVNGQQIPWPLGGELKRLVREGVERNLSAEFGLTARDGNSHGRPSVFCRRFPRHVLSRLKGGEMSYARQRDVKPAQDSAEEAWQRWKIKDAQRDHIAENAKRGFWVYFIYAEAADAVKIGFTGVSVETRMAAIQMHCPVKLTIIGKISGAKHLEDLLHRKFDRHRLHGEWFRLDDEIKAFIAERATP